MKKKCLTEDEIKQRPILSDFKNFEDFETAYYSWLNTLSQEAKSRLGWQNKEYRQEFLVSTPPEVKRQKCINKDDLLNEKPNKNENRSTKMSQSNKTKDARKWTTMAIRKGTMDNLNLLSNFQHRTAGETVAVLMRYYFDNKARELNIAPDELKLMIKNYERFDLTDITNNQIR